MRATLEDVCQKGSSNLMQKDIGGKTGSYPIYGASGLIGFVDFYHQAKSCVAVVKDGAGIGRTMLLPAYSSVIGTMQYLIPKDNVLPEYLYYVVSYMHLSKYFTGATIPHIYFKDYKKEEFNLHDKGEQTKIVDVLSRIERIIEARRSELTTLDNLIKAQFVEMFGTENDFSQWQICTVGDIAEICVGVVIKPTQYYREKGTPAFRSLNVGELCIKDNEWVYFSREGHEKNKKSVIRENDVLIVRSGAPGTACVATAKYDGYNAVDIIIAHPDCSKVNPLFLAAFTNMPHGRNQIKAKTGGAAQQHFNVNSYKAVQLILPPLEMQNKFAAFVTQIDKSKFRCDTSRNLWKYAVKCIWDGLCGEMVL